MSSSPQSRSCSFKSIGDVVLEHAAQDTMSTDDGIRLLELNGHITQGSLNGAGNIYLSALSIIRDLQKQLASRSETTEQDAARYRWLVSRESIGWDGWDAFTSITATKEKVDPLIDAELNRSNRQGKQV
jgi:hypothetical protein